MSARKKTAPASIPTTKPPVKMCLYIAENAPNSMAAVANLEQICNEHLKDAFTLEIVDVMTDPLRALADGIVVTPSLAKISPLPATKIVGNLSDRTGVLRALGIRA
ncbi:MAG: circadian clock KaiB family protein [Pseudomonadota bacterium]|nr:circadian clock KaiB family protein [Pseudomonadota bacterium]